jgi:hypothetical protein
MAAVQQPQGICSFCPFCKFCPKKENYFVEDSWAGRDQSIAAILYCGRARIRRRSFGAMAGHSPSPAGYGFTPGFTDYDWDYDLDYEGPQRQGGGPTPNQRIIKLSNYRIIPIPAWHVPGRNGQHSANCSCSSRSNQSQGYRSHPPRLMLVPEVL